MSDNYNHDNQDDYLTQEKPQLIGYDFYTKEEIYSSDNYVRDAKGNLYLRENFLQANLGTDGKLIDTEEE